MATVERVDEGREGGKGRRQITIQWVLEKNFDKNFYENKEHSLFL